MARRNEARGGREAKATPRPTLRRGVAPGRMRVVLKRRPSRSVGVSSGEGARQLTHRSNPPSQPFDPPHPSTFDQQSNHPRPQPPHHSIPSSFSVSPKVLPRVTVRGETPPPRTAALSRGSPLVQARRRRSRGCSSENRRADDRANGENTHRGRQSEQER